MNQMSAAWVIASLAIALVACGESKQPTAANTPSTAVEMTEKGPHAEPELRNTFTAKLGGQSFDISIDRKADTSLPVVVDDMGNQYADNSVYVTIGCEGKVFFEKSYTKADFDSMLSESEKKGTVLLGMAYDAGRSNDKVLCIGAQIGQVGIEEGPAFCIEVPLNGQKATIKRDIQQDTTGDEMMD